MDELLASGAHLPRVQDVTAPLLSMPRVSLAAVPIVVTIVAGILSGCAPMPQEELKPAPVEQTATSPSTDVLSEEEILARAMDVLRGYSATAMQVASDYSVDPSILSPYMTEAGIDEKRALQDQSEAAGLRLTGQSVYSDEQVQEYNPSVNRLTLLVCEDFSEVRVVDSSGRDVTPLDRSNEATMRVSFALTPEGPRIERSVVWDGSDLC